MHKRYLALVIVAVVLVSTVLAVIFLQSTPSSTPYSIAFMPIEQLSITDVAWTDAGNTITVTVQNSGTTDVKINTVKVNDTPVPITPFVVPLNTEKVIVLTSPWIANNGYYIKFVSSKGNNFPYNAVASP